MIRFRDWIVWYLRYDTFDVGISQDQLFRLFRYHQLGGRLVYGSDTGFLPDYHQGEEFRQLRQAGFGFRDVLPMLTTAPAEFFHLSQREGKVMPGMRRDLTILSEDPCSGRPEVFTEVKYTIRGGKVIWRSN